MTLLAITAVARAQSPESPLAPPDRSSPRATLATFMKSCDAVGAFLRAGYMVSPTHAGSVELAELARVPIDCLDLSQVSAAARIKLAPAAALELYEVLSRIKLPPPDSIPDSLPDSLPGSAPDPATTPEPSHWTIPGTEITLVRGPAGQYRFSPETVARSTEFYDRVKQLPYLHPVPIENIHMLPIEGGGWLVPLAWVMGWPAWLRTSVAGEAVWKWIAVAVLALVLLMLVRAAHWLSKRGSEERPLRQAILRLSLPAFFLLATPAAAYIALAQINLTGRIGVATILAATAALSISGAWLAWRMAPVVAEAIIASPSIVPESIDAHLIRVTVRLFSIAIGAMLLAVGADQLGVPIYGIVAGLGVGGIALALAAQPTIENLIGGLSLFADKPVRVGDVGRFGDVQGTVEAIGIRSTRIRGKDRTVTTIPNATLAKGTIVNFSRRDRLLLNAQIGLRYETSPAQLRSVLAALRSMLQAEPRVDAESVRVRLAGFGASSLDIDMEAYVKMADGQEFTEIREALFLQVIDIVERSGTSLAFPSQTLYLARDSGIRAGPPAGADPRPVEGR